MNWANAHAGTVRQAPSELVTESDLYVNGGVFQTGQPYELVTGAKTLDEGDAGVIQRVTATATVTLPATVVGTTYIVENGGPDGKVTVTVSPNAADKVMGNGFTSADNKAAINTLGNKGDRLVLVGDGVNGWFVVESVGTWTRAA